MRQELDVELLKNNPFELLARGNQAHPEKLAVAGGVFSQSYRELFDQSLKAANYLHSFGLAKGDIVTIELPNQMIPAFIFGAFYEGLVVSPHLGGGETKLPIKIAATISFRPESRIPLAKRIQVQSDFFESDLPSDLDQSGGSAAWHSSESMAEYALDSVCRLELSSGTTGRAKAIPITILMLLKRINASYINREVDANYFSLASLGNGMGFISLLIQITAGNTFFLPTSTKENLELIERFEIATVIGSPAQIGDLVDLARQMHNRLPTLLHIQFGGSQMNPKLFGILKQNLDLLSVKTYYGSAETLIVTTGDYRSDLPGFVGKVVLGAEVQVVDESLNQMPVGETGIIRVKTKSQAEQYLGDKKETAKAFRDGWFYAGDLGYLDAEGNLFQDGRASERINASGKKLNPTAMEMTCIVNAEISDAAVFTYLDQGGVERLGLAFVSAEVPDIAAMHNLLVSEFGFSVPARYIRVPVVPRNEGGKISRQELSDLVEKM